MSSDLSCLFVPLRPLLAFCWLHEIVRDCLFPEYDFVRKFTFCLMLHFQVVYTLYILQVEELLFQS